VKKTRRNASKNGYYTLKQEYNTNTNKTNILVGSRQQVDIIIIMDIIMYIIGLP
jgi:predicted nicotinamide N-methyase